MNGINPEIALRKAVNRYFDGLFRSDCALLRDVFHPMATVIGYTGDDTLKAVSLDDFLEFVAKVPAPADNGVPFEMAILSVDRTGKAASVKVRDYYLNRDYIDYLHMAETADGWKITAKAFHSDPRA